MDLTPLDKNVRKILASVLYHEVMFLSTFEYKSALKTHLFDEPVIHMLDRSFNLNCGCCLRPLIRSG